MHLTEAQLRSYTDNGFLFLPECFTRAEIDTVKAELPTIFAEDSLRRVLEKESNIVRSVYGSHTTNEVAYRLAHHPRIVEPAMQILDGKTYIYQFKINAKAAFGGDVWEWHQDYIFWQNEDGMPLPRVVNAVIFLDEVHEFNGPLIFIPGSHQEGVIDVRARNVLPSGYQNNPAWISNLTADLKYSLDKGALATLVERYGGMVAPKGLAGSVLFFHGNVVHGSAANISPFDRNIVLVTFNSLENIPVPTKEPRPEFLVSRDFRPVEPLADTVLFS
jgi:ectoine hydroxylase-related dioxygenase (phytanoyl-CoA dioxygenase family)